MRIEKKRGQPARAAIVAVLALVLCIGGISLVVFATSSAFISAPAWMRNAIENQIQAHIGARTIVLDDVRLSMDLAKWSPVLRIEGLDFSTAEGASSVAVEEATIEFALSSFFLRQFKPTTINAQGIDVKLLANSYGWAGTGVLDSERQPPSPDTRIGSIPAGSPHSDKPALPDVSQRVLSALDSGALSTVRELSVEGINIDLIFDDEEAWRFENGWAMFRRSATGISGRATVSPARQMRAEDEIQISLDFSSGQAAPQIRVSFTDFAVDPIIYAMFGLNNMVISNSVASGTVEIQTDDALAQKSITARVSFKGGSTAMTILDTSVQLNSADINATFDPESGKLEIYSLSLDTDVAQFSANGSVYIENNRIDSQDSIFGNLRFEDAILDPHDFFETPLDSLSGTLEFRIRPSVDELEIAQLTVERNETKLVASGTLFSRDGDQGLGIDFRANRLSHKNVFAWWPPHLVPSTRIWLLENLHGGEFSQLAGAFRYVPGRKPELLLTFRADEMALSYIKTFPPIRDGRGYASLSLEEFNFEMESGRVTVPAFGDISLDGSGFRIPDIRDATRDSAVHLRFSGRMSPILALLNHPPFGFLDAAAIPLDIAVGYVSGTANLTFPLQKAIQVQDVEVMASGTISDFSSRDFMGKRTFFGDQLSVYVDNSGITISGNGVLGSVPVSGAWSQKFSPGTQTGGRIEGTLAITDTLLREFKIQLKKEILSGSAMASFYVLTGAGLIPRFVGTSNLSGLEINVPSLRLAKPANKQGQLIVEGQFTHPIALERIEFEVGPLTASGNATFKPDGNLESAVFDSLKYQDWLDASVTLRRQHNGTLEYKIKGKAIEYQEVSKTTEFNSIAASVPGIFELEFDRVTLSSGITLTEFSGTLGAEDNNINQFTAKVNGGPIVNLKAVQTSEGLGFRVGSADAGAVFRSLNMTDNLHGGSLEALFIPVPNGGGFRGILEIRDAVAKNMPALSELLSYISVVGLLDKLTTEGITFDSIDARFDLSASEIILHEGTAVGQSLGVTMKGRLNLAVPEIDVRGVITPAYGLNQLIDTVTPIGKIFGMGKGEGFGAVDYAIKGPIDNPNAVANPISAATPGFFRDLFPDLAPSK